MSSIDTSTPVVVLRSVHHAGLGISRSLGRLGVGVYTIDPDRWTPAFASRYCRGKGRWDIENASPADSVRYLLDFVQGIGGRAILIPTTDSTTMFLAQNAGALRESFLFPEQPARLVASLCRKDCMHSLARGLGVPSPDTFCPQSRHEVLEFIDRATFPIMLKPIVEKRTRNGARQRKYIASSPRELLETYDAVEDLDDPNMMLQEYIPGGEDTIWMFNGYFDARSDCLLGFTGKKLRQFPAYTGATSLGICLRNDAVDGTTRRFMKAIGYTRDSRYRIPVRCARRPVQSARCQSAHRQHVPALRRRAWHGRGTRALSRLDAAAIRRRARSRGPEMDRRGLRLHLLRALRDGSQARRRSLAPVFLRREGRRCFRMGRPRFPCSR